jgi:hypothetical protein
MLKTDPVRKDFEEALARLKAGMPLNEDLKKKQRVGKLKINILTVALEAGRSRTSIGLENCRYPDIRDQILRMRPAPSSKGESMQNIAIRRSRDNRSLQSENRMLLSHNAALIIALEKRDKELFRLRKKHPLAEHEGETTPLVGGNVLRLRRKVRPDRST